MVMLVNIYADATGRRMVACMVCIGILLLGTVCLLIWDIPFGLRIVAYLFAADDGPLSPLFMSWANILCSSDRQVRAMTIACMNAFGNATSTIIQQFLYPVTDAPEYKKGFAASLAFICGMLGWTFVVRYFELQNTNQRLPEVEGLDGEREMDSLEGSLKQPPVQMAPIREPKV